MEWVENQGLPSKMEKYLLQRNPKKSFFILLVICVVVTVFLGYFLIETWMYDVNIYYKIFGTILFGLVIFIGYYGSWSFYISEIHQPHKIKWENGKIYLKNKYTSKVFIYPFSNIVKIEFTRNGSYVREGEMPTEVVVEIKRGKRGGVGIALGLEVGERLREAWEQWRIKDDY